MYMIPEGTDSKDAEEFTCGTLFGGSVGLLEPNAGKDRDSKKLHSNENIDNGDYCEKNKWELFLKVL